MVTGKRMAVSVALVGLLMATGFGSANAKPSATTGVFTDQAEFEEAVKTHKRGPDREELSEKVKQERREKYSAELSQVSPDDFEAQNRIARKYNLAIYNPNLGVGTMTSGSGDISITRPVKGVDYESGDTFFNTQATWRYLAPIQSDSKSVSGTVMGGYDRFGLVFSNVTDPAQITWAVNYAYDKSGALRHSTSTRDSVSNEGVSGRFAFLFAFPDMYTNTTTWCTCYNIVTWVFFTPSWADHGNVFGLYAHDYNNTQLSSLGFNLGGEVGPTSWKGNFGIELTWTTSLDKWAGESLQLSY